MRRLLFLFIDVACVGVTAIFALILRDNLEVDPVRVAAVLPYAVLSMLSAIVVLPVAGTHRGIWRFSSLPDYVRVVGGAVVTILLAVGLGFAVFRLDGVARSLPIIHALLLIAGMVLVRVVLRLRQVWRNRRSHQANGSSLAVAPEKEAIVVAGVGPVAHLFLQSLADLGKEEVHVAGVLGKHGRHTGSTFYGYSVLGSIEDARIILKRLEVHGVQVARIVVTARPDHLSLEARDELNAIEAGGGIIVDYFAERLVARDDVARHDGPYDQGMASLARQIATSELGERVRQRSYWRVKRVIDCLAALLLILALSPLIALVAFLVLLEIGIPTVFWQQRPGRFGIPFKVYKFRTMSVAHDSDGKLIPDDQRVSLVGRVLRATRLDELPQLFNILIGEMSFVGPRPLLPRDQRPDHAERLLVAPGLTGWAQVNGGREVLADDKVAMDLWYIRHASLWLDLKIIVLTGRMIVLGERTRARAIAQAWQEQSGRMPPAHRLAWAENGAEGGAFATSQRVPKSAY